MEVGETGETGDPAVLNVAGEQRPDIVHVTNHDLNMEESHAEDQPHIVQIVARNIVQSMENGDPGAHGDPAVLNVTEGKNADLEPVPGLNMEAGPVQDQP